ncbi:MAG: ACT domain-containing protein [Oscillospiraceae bacterium]|nr:ACT domain-containing protein [Oscillospiraceae bacterium]
MKQEQKYYLIEASALPEIFLKVAEVKRILETGELDKVSDATRRVGISRSAFYKYKDSILPFQNLMAGRIITFQILLRDTAGLLSKLLTVFAGAGANILTINQTIPVGEIASVTISAETTQLECAVEALLARIGELEGVYKAEILAG